MQGAVLEESKGDLRRAMLSRRKSHAPANCYLWSRRIQSQALRLPQYLAAKAVALYSPIENEVDTAAILADALERKKQILYQESVTKITLLLRDFLPSGTLSGPIRDT
jgi:5-formyltetrahydrofolate cyclo-ligase